MQCDREDGISQIVPFMDTAVRTSDIMMLEEFCLLVYKAV
jgi:hypothetical protein